VQTTVAPFRRKMDLLNYVLLFWLSIIY